MGARLLCLLVVLLGLPPNAMAAERAGIMHRMSCVAVRYYVALYSATAAEQYARSQGATDADIDAARGCIRSNLTHTASAQKIPGKWRPVARLCRSCDGGDRIRSKAFGPAALIRALPDSSRKLNPSPWEND